MKISVIVPVYKVEPYLHRCVDSILAQTFADFELILVDDGSPDNCGVICDEYAEMDRRVRVIHQANAGISAARNAGIEGSRGEYIAFVDSDDWVHCKYLEYLHSAICDNGTSISCCEYQEVKEYVKDICPDGPIYSSVRRPEDVYMRTNYRGIQAYAWRYLIHRDLFDGIRFPVGRLWEDIFTIPRIIFQVEKIAYTDQKLYYYFSRQDSVVHSGWNVKKMDSLDAMEFNLDFLSDYPSQKLLECLAVEYLMQLAGNYWSVKLSDIPISEKRRLYMIFSNKGKWFKNRHDIYRGLTKNQQRRAMPILHPIQFAFVDFWSAVKCNISDRIQILMDKMV